MSWGERSCTKYGSCGLNPTMSECHANCKAYKWDGETTPEHERPENIKLAEWYQEYKNPTKPEQSKEGMMPITGRCRAHTWNKTGEGYRICSVCGKKKAGD